MDVKSRRLSGAAPLDRAILDSAASPVRVAFGVLFLGWSWVSTVLIGGAFLAPLLPREVAGGISASYVVAFAFALLVTVVEFVSAGRWPLVYALVLLICDASLTSWQTYKWLLAIVTTLYPLADITAAGMAGLGIASIVCGIIAAVLGELLLFGRR